MARQTIDFGIDLGTTNSSIAALEKNGPSIFRNNEGNQITPSAVYIDKQGAIRVGDAAKDRIVSEPNDAVSEFKLWMGTEQKKMFAAGEPPLLARRALGRSAKEPQARR